MIQEVTQSQYPGVPCSRCKEPIPVPKRVAALYGQLKHADLADEHDPKSRAFTLRCRACNEESVYAVDEIREFDSPPRARTLQRKRAASAGK